MKTFGEQIKSDRIHKKWDQKTLAKLLVTTLEKLPKSEQPSASKDRNPTSLHQWISRLENNDLKRNLDKLTRRWLALTIHGEEVESFYHLYETLPLKKPDLDFEEDLSGLYTENVMEDLSKHRGVVFIDTPPPDGDSFSGPSSLRDSSILAILFEIIVLRKRNVDLFTHESLAEHELSLRFLFALLLTKYFFSKKCELDKFKEIDTNFLDKNDKQALESSCSKTITLMNLHRDSSPLKIELPQSDLDEILGYLVFRLEPDNDTTTQSNKGIEQRRFNPFTYALFKFHHDKPTHLEHFAISVLPENGKVTRIPVDANALDLYFWNMTKKYRDILDRDNCLNELVEIAKLLNVELSWINGIN
ncbi:MAG: hypothetical protein KZQ96_21265 [Candidatus Thiodiazotropha sp. (ex Lucinoma borealis)]|nr:hypothetical protein [Candidatus Thiodiazotropha sp. (ex Lucinoma borealis)]